MLVQPSRTATVCEVDRARKRAASRKRAQNLGSRTNNRWRFITPKTIHLTLTCSCEACSAFTRVAARTLAPSPIRDQLHRRLQPFRHLHDCSGCFRPERSPGGTCTHWKAPPSHGARKHRSFLDSRASYHQPYYRPTVEAGDTLIDFGHVSLMIAPGGGNRWTALVR